MTYLTDIEKAGAEQFYHYIQNRMTKIEKVAKRTGLDEFIRIIRSQISRWFIDFLKEGSK